ncbi:methyltransferase [Streptomyces sp. URMC 123]|uniref:methyltransferase n=1 Tax=Streptomyces sp. URMC 123 TaxID=3423403 RepID=UPI003F19719B
MASDQPDPALYAGQLAERSMGFLHTAALHAAARFDIADHLATGPRSAAELAQLCGARAGHLERLLRFLASTGVFHEDAGGRFHLTPLAEPLRSDAPYSLRDGVVTMGEELFWRPVARLHEAVRTGETVFDEVFGASFFGHLARNPEQGAAFNRGMASFSAADNDTIASHYDFPEGATVVDVGGGRGGLLRAILARNPGVSGILYDQESVVRQHLLDGPELEGRWRTEAGSFFDSVPAGADIYILKAVLHDWTDEECVRILRAVRHGMAEGSRLLVVEAVLPEDNEPHRGWALDLLMMVLLNGKERTPQEFQGLYTEAGLKVTRVLPTPVYVSMIEGILA